MATPLLRHLTAVRQAEVARIFGGAALPAWASFPSRHYADKPAADKPAADKPPVAPAAGGAAEASGSSITEGSAVEGVEKEEVWTEVVHQTTGQMYYWNQRTGETTDLDDPKPTGRYKEGASGGGGHGGGSPGVDINSEAPLPDRTGFYAGMGALLGAVLGWGSQLV